jgi:hypothetical protein
MEVCLENKPEPEVDGGGEAFEPSNIRKGYYNQAIGNGGGSIALTNTKTCLKRR